jgi:hypothetical protein
MNDKDLKDIVDNGTTYATVGHIYARGFFDERPTNECKDVCLKMFGEQDEECIEHNAKIK